MRHNIFNTVHLPLKTALITACISISKAIEQEVPVTEAIQQLEEVLQTFNEQVIYEGLHVLPLVFAYEEGIWNNYTSEHNTATKLSSNIERLLQSCKNQKKEEEKLKMLTLLNEKYNEYFLFNFNHMDDEEIVLNEILWRYYQDDVLKQIEEKFYILPHTNEQGKRAGIQIATAA